MSGANWCCHRGNTEQSEDAIRRRRGRLERAAPLAGTRRAGLHPFRRKGRTAKVGERPEKAGPSSAFLRIAGRTLPLPQALRLLLLGGTTEASRLALALAGRPDVEAIVSLAGRTQAPVAPPLPFRIGGFGGIEGLVRYLRAAGIQAVVDATHPFAARISANARIACAQLPLPLAAFTRLPWTPSPGDRWLTVPDLDAAARALGPTARRVFLTTGRLGLAAFKPASQHDYLIRTIDPPDVADLPARSRVVLARGPFAMAEEIELMQRQAIEILVTKNSGGPAGAGKLAAARALGLPVVLVEAPRPPDTTTFFDLADVLAWIAAHQRLAP